MATPLSKLLTPQQAAQRLGVSVDTIQQYARAPLNRLRAVRFLGRLLFDPKELNRYTAGLSKAGRPKRVAKQDADTT